MSTPDGPRSETTERQTDQDLAAAAEELAARRRVNGMAAADAYEITHPQWCLAHGNPEMSCGCSTIYRHRGAATKLRLGTRDGWIKVRRVRFDSFEYGHHAIGEAMVELTVHNREPGVNTFITLNRSDANDLIGELDTQFGLADADHVPGATDPLHYYTETNR